MYKKILVASDGSIHAKKAIAAAADVARKYKAELTVITIIQHPMDSFGIYGLEELGTEAYSLLKKKGDEIQKEAKEQLKDLHDLNVFFILDYGNPGDTIVQYAKKKNFDLIVMGSHGYSETMAHILGSVSDRVNHNAHCSILIVK